MNESKLPSDLILFDGVCKFCNASINLIIRNDSKNIFYFATIQSSAGNTILTQLGFDPQSPTTFVYLKNGTVYTQSNAALEIASCLKPPMSYLAVLKIIPRFLRDWAYQLVAHNRYRILGRNDSCMIPSKELQSRFLD